MATVLNGIASVTGAIRKGGAFGHVVFALLLWHTAHPLT
jgi:hypothetical protein